MIAFCDIDAFYASVEEILRPELKGKPIIVGGSSGIKGVVATASYEARRYGVHLGMPIFQARKLCPHCIFLDGNFRIYEEYSRKFFNILEQFSPVVEHTSVDEAYLDITGCERLFGTPPEIGLMIKRRVFEETGLKVTIGIGISRGVSKMAADTVKPDGLIYIPEGDTPEFLKSIPLERAKGLGNENRERLKNMGLKTVGDVLALPCNILGRVLDRGGLNWVFSLTERGLNTGKKVKSVGRESTLYHNTGDVKVLLPLLYYLVERSVRDMRRKGYRTTRVVVKVRFSDFKTITRGKRIPATDISSDIFRVASILLEDMVDRFVRLIGVRLEGFVPASGLFPDDKKERLEEGIHYIRERFGFNSILHARVLEMKRNYVEDGDGFRLRTPSCSH